MSIFRFRNFKIEMTSEEAEEWERSPNQTSDVCSSNNHKDENQETTNLKQYRKKITPDGRIVRVLLSDGETSSGIESVSSADALDDVVSDDMNAFMKNVLVEVKNEFAIPNIEGEKLLTDKKMDQQDFINGCDEDGDEMDLVNSPPYGGLEEESHEIVQKSRSSSEQQFNDQGSKRSELSAFSKRSDERVSRVLRRGRRSKRSRSLKRHSSKRLHSSSRSRSVSRNRRRLPSQERRSKRSRRKLSRSLSRGRSRSLTRKRPRSLSRRSRSLIKKRPTSLSRKRSKSLSKTKIFNRRRSRSLSKRRSKSPIRRSRSLNRKRSKSPIRRSRSLNRRSKSPIRRSRSLNRRRSKSPIRKSRSLSKRSKSPITRSRSSSRRSRSSTKKSSSRKRSRSHEKVSSTSYDKRESGIRDGDSSISYYAVTEARRERGVRNIGFQSTTIQVSGYFPPPPVFAPRYYWKGVYRYPRGPAPGAFYPSAKRLRRSVYDEYPTPVLKVNDEPNVPSIKSPSPDNTTKDNSPKTESKQDQTETSSEVSSRSSPSEGNVCTTDTGNRPLPKVPDSTCCGSLEVSEYHTPIPTVGLDNRPLVPGPAGLPVHISPTGVTIPYDMDGRRVPIGPNGHYLPLDVSGRLFPHVITVENNAVPIYISEDGVLRLPDSRPVPFGSPHKLPVNIDGKMILMGPDSRPLVPCPNLPVQPPVVLDQVLSRKFVRKPEIESPQSESNQVVDSSGIEIVDLHLIDDLNENKNINSKRNEPNSSCDTQTEPFKLESAMNPLSVIRAAPNIQEILNSVDENLLKKVQELTQQQNKAEKKKLTLREDAVVIQIRSVIKSLIESNYEPPQLGRFYVSETMFEPPESDIDVNLQSPLLRNRVKLPFITPKEEEESTLSPPESPESPERDITYTFISTGNFNVFEEKTADETCVDIDEESLRKGKCLNKSKTIELGVQCDFTSDEINEHILNVSKLRNELLSVQKAYSKLLEMYEDVLSSKAEVLENAA